MTHIAVIGAGITGITTAYSLLKKGYQVTVFDRHPYAAMETSFANGGQLSASNAEVWNSTSTLIKGMKWMMRKDAPLLLNPLPSWHKYSWLTEFVAQIPNYRANTIATTKLAIEARKHLFEIAAAENIGFNHEKRGILHIYRDKASYDVAAATNLLLTEGGLERHSVTPSEIRQIEPTLASNQLYGGFYTPSDSTGDIHLFTKGLAEACVKKGARIIYNSTVTATQPKEQGIDLTWSVAHGGGFSADDSSNDFGHFDAMVVCAGVESRAIAASLNDRINIYPVKGYSITVMLNDEESRDGAPMVSLLDEDTKIVTSRLGRDRFRVAGTAEFNGFNRDIRSDRIAPLVAWTRRYFPKVSTEHCVPWTGLRPMTPNMMPYIGQGQHPSVFYNTGHGHLGWTLSAATAELITSQIGTKLAIAA
jgi:D-amino-acid dehydrogenase